MPSKGHNKDKNDQKAGRGLPQPIYYDQNEIQIP